LRPFYFIVVVWGKEFSDYLLEYCIPSLLSPRNIPSLGVNKQNKFLICTPDSNWDYLCNSDSFKLLKEYLTPELMPIPEPPAGISGCEHMGIGHKMACNKCFVDKAYAIVLTPDLMMSDGTIELAFKQAKAGKNLVLTAALRFATEPLFALLEQKLNFNPKVDFRPALTISGRQLVDIALDSMHSQTRCYQFDSKNYIGGAPASFWRMPNDAGIILHSMSWLTLLIDYSVLDNHDTSCLEDWTIDGDYIYKNFGTDTNTYLSVDSDETLVVSWASLNDRPLPLADPDNKSKFGYIRKIKNSLLLNSTLCDPIYDKLKLEQFKTPVFWHRFDLDEKWHLKEMEIEKIINTSRAKKDKFSLTNILSIDIAQVFRYITGNIILYYQKLKYSLILLADYIRVIFQAALGDKDCRSKIMRRIKIILRLNTQA